jgi:hypothetical protein
MPKGYVAYVSDYVYQNKQNQKGVNSVFAKGLGVHVYRVWRFSYISFTTPLYFNQQTSKTASSAALKILTAQFLVRDASTPVSSLIAF